jgi:uncharacterized membrane protein YfhO
MDFHHSISDEKTEASLLRQVLIGLVDVVLALLVVVLISIYKFPDPLYQLFSFVNPTLLVLLWFVIYRLVCFLFFDRTIGMKLFHAILLNGELEPLSVKEKILASVFILYRGVGYYND